MYLEFYGLTEKPFDPTPDPRFLYLSAAHRDALAQLLYGVQESRGFMALIGEVGTGKTTLLQKLLRRMDPGDAVAYVFDSTLSFDELLEYALEDFGVSTPGESRARRLAALNRFLVEQRRKGHRAVLIIDEAQNLDAPTLEQVRLLSNFESATEKLLQIVLVGQPELRARLRRADLRQLRQRIALRCAIRPLTPREIRDYIRSRLRVAGATDLGLFTESAVRRIARYTGGIPRMINILCDHCLVLGYAEERRRIDAGVVHSAIDHLESAGIGDRPRRWWRWSLWPVAAACTGVVAATAAAAGLLAR
jgi:general secretion pathway protein A